jgi:hypothetical protein
MNAWAVFFLIWILDAPSLQASLIIPSAPPQVVIDGELPDEEWGQALHLPLAYEVSPGENLPPRYETTMLLQRDAHRILIAFLCNDPRPEEIVARFSDRDQLFNDDWVGVAFDTFNDQKRAYEFTCNPLGVQMDAINDEVGGQYDTNWNALWQAKTRRTAKGYQVEMAIPLNQIRFPHQDASGIWGVDGFRSVPRDVRYHHGAFPRQRNANSYLAQMLKVSGFHHLQPTANLQVTPTWTGSQTKTRNPEDAPGWPDAVHDSDIGITAKWGLTPSITLGGTIHPDFSQVEADAIQLTVNEPFSPFFAETRPFFKEGAEYFALPYRLLHTRTVSDVGYAAKMTGKQDRHTFAAFLAEDQQTPLLIPGPEGSQSAVLPFKSTALALRYAMDFGDNSSAGVMATYRGAEDYHNQVISADLLYRPSSAHSLRLQCATTQTQDNEAIVTEFGLKEAERDGGMLLAKYQLSRRNYSVKLSHLRIDEDFRTDLGFQSRGDLLQTVIGTDRVWYREGRLFHQITLGGDWDESRKTNQELLEREEEFWLIAEGPLQSTIQFGGGHRIAYFSGTAYDQTFFWFNPEGKPAPWLKCSLTYDLSDWIDFAHNRPATYEALRFDGTLTMGSHIKLVASHQQTALDLEEGRLYTTTVHEATATYFFNTHAHLRLKFQNPRIKRQPERYLDPVSPHTEDRWLQLLFTYQLNPQTLAYLGYSTAKEAFAEAGLVEVQQQLFAKFSYAWLP